MALPLILGLLGSSLGAGTAIGAVGAGALASGVGRFLETGDFEEGLKTGAVSALGGYALQGALGALGGSKAAETAVKAGQEASKATFADKLSAFPKQLQQPYLGSTNTLGGLQAAASNPITLGQSTIAQAAVKPPQAIKPEEKKTDTRERLAPRRIMRRPPPGYNPNTMGEFDYGVAPNYGVGIVGMRGGGLSNPEKADLDGDGSLSSYERRRGEAIEKSIAEQKGANVGGLQEMSDTVGNMPEAQGSAKIIDNARRAIADLEIFTQTFGLRALDDLQEMMGSDIDLSPMIRGEGDGMSDRIDAEVVDKKSSPKGTGDPLKVANNEYVVAADVVSDLGNGSSDAGAKKLDDMMKRVRMARHGTDKQPPEVATERLMPA